MKFNFIKESKFTSDIFLPYLSPTCPYACCNKSQAMRQRHSSFAYYQKPRYSMPPGFLQSSSVNYQIVPIRHSLNLNRSTPVRNINLNSFNGNRATEERMIRNAEERRSPYYYNELTRMHASSSNNSQFVPISSGNENFIDFINTIHPQG